MLTLACDTSNSTCCAGLYRDGQELAYKLSMDTRTHSETFMPLVHEVMEEAGVSHKEIDRYAITVGPGSFTGIRIGLSAVKGMALVNDSACVPVSATKALMRSVENISSEMENTIIISCFDARNNRVFASVAHNKDFKDLIEENAYDATKLAHLIDALPEVMNAREAPSSLPLNILVIGSGSDVMRQALADTGVIPNGEFAPGIKVRYAKGAVILPKGVFEASKDVESVSGAAIGAAYFAKSQAERFRNAD